LGTVRAVAGLGGATPAETGHISFYGLSCGPDGVDASDGLIRIPGDGLGLRIPGLLRSG